MALALEMLSFSRECSLKLQFVKSLFGPLGSQQYCAVSAPPPLWVSVAFWIVKFMWVPRPLDPSREEKKKNKCFVSF